MRFRCQGPSLAVHAPAKLNLFLEVLGRRPDGYHELETVMVSIALYDTLVFTKSASQQIRLRCHRVEPGSPSLSDGPQNLVHRAATLLRERAGGSRGVDIDLFKRIPMQAGLGGGSSDAAATLVALNRFWNLALSSAELHTLAAELGSDLNFFVDSPTAARCTGRGEQVEPLPLSRRLHFVVLCPRTGLATGAVFRRWSETAGHDRRVVPLPSDVRRGQVSPGTTALYNALQRPAEELNPHVAQTLEVLEREGAPLRLMSGSGTACFAVCSTRHHANSLAGRLRPAFAGKVLTVNSGV
jgi:4-diphosphocytidyl-2-C-methyl-D-erythritol kinase